MQGSHIRLTSNPVRHIITVQSKALGEGPVIMLNPGEQMFRQDSLGLQRNLAADSPWTDIFMADV